MAKNPRNVLERGFTLIELLLVILVVAILIVVVMGLLNPFAQFTKAADSQREHDLNQIRVAIDSYYNDTGCYPTTIPFGSPFVDPNKPTTIYMKSTPQDPKCSTDSSKCYRYITDTTISCPQWNVLLGSLRAPSLNTQSRTLCSLETLDSSSTANGGAGCLPRYYKSSGYNFCLTSGQVDCSVIAGTGDLPTPTITSAPQCQKVYSCTSFSPQAPLGVCNIVGTDSQGNGLGNYCGAPGCSGNACCLNNCSQ